jgi:hypothetical protein
VPPSAEAWRETVTAVTLFPQMAERADWILLAYRLPREPSTPRITMWRKLKRLGVVQILDGLVALPLDARNREQLEWIADEMAEAGGQASIWKAQPTTARQERELVAGMQSAIDAEYEKLITEATSAVQEARLDRRSLKRLRAEIRRIQRRDYFPTRKGVEARRAVEKLAGISDAVG